MTVASTVKRNGWLDVVRGLAIVAVILVHTGHSTRTILNANHMTLSGKIVAFTDLGAAGVELFFFISGWLLASIYGNASQPLGRAYWLRRIGRIIPLWLLFLGLTVLTSHIAWSGRWHQSLAATASEGGFFHNPIVAILLTATFTLWVSPGLWNHVIGGGWSIQAEVGHYLWFPVLRRFSLNGMLKALAATNIVTLLLIEFARMNGKQSNFLILAVKAWIRLDLYATIGFFILGLIAYRVWAKTQEGESIGAAFASLKVSPATAVIYALTFAAVPLAYGKELASLGFILLCLAISYGAYKVSWAAKSFATIGKYSYFVYFCHFFVLDIVRYYGKKYLHLTGPNWLLEWVVLVGVFACALLISLALAVPSFRFFEKPIMRLARRFE